MILAFTREGLIAQAKDYEANYKPNTGYASAAMAAVCAADLDPEDYINIEFMLQFDGRETIEDETQWDAAEKRIPYGDSRSLEKSDCSSFPRNVDDMLWHRNIGEYTESIRSWAIKTGRWVGVSKDLPYDAVIAMMEPGDLPCWNFKAAKGRNISHIGTYLGNSRILHTTSTGNPMRVDAASYSKSKMIGFVRLYTSEERESLKVKNIGGAVPVKTAGPSYKRLIKFEYAAKVGTTLRAGAGGGYSALKTIPKGGRVTFMGRVGSWLRVYYGGKTGYVQATAFAKRDYLRGEDVRSVQQALQAAGFDPGEIDGVYGQQTAAAVVAYQTAKGLTVDGVVGPVTWAALIG
jgi:hypothetical protein